jgi:hypothetical protein
MHGAFNFRWLNNTKLSSRFNILNSIKPTDSDYKLSIFLQIIIKLLSNNRGFILKSLVLIFKLTCILRMQK